MKKLYPYFVFAVVLGVFILAACASEAVSPCPCGQVGQMVCPCIDVNSSTMVVQTPVVQLAMSPVATIVDSGLTLEPDVPGQVSTITVSNPDVQIVDTTFTQLSPDTEFPGRVIMPESLVEFFDLAENEGNAFTLILNDGSLRPLPIIHYNFKSEDDQVATAVQLVRAAKAGGWTVNFEIGFGPAPFSIIDAVSRRSNTLVIGFDQNQYTPYRFDRQEFMNVNIPVEGGSSVGAIFNINAWRYQANSEVTGNIAYSISPFPHQISHFLMLGARIADFGYVVPSPKHGQLSHDSVSKQVRELDSALKVYLIELDLNQIEQLFGTKKSMFLTEHPPTNGLYQVFYATYK